MPRPSTLSLAGVALALALAGCRGETRSPQGRYRLDQEEFVETGLRALQDAGRVPSGAEGLARTMLRQVKFDLTLAADHTFEASMTVPGESHSYTGTWRKAGRRITIRQTHEDGEEVEDLLTGTVESDALHLDHDEQGLTMRYVLRRVEPASPR